MRFLFELSCLVAGCAFLGGIRLVVTVLVGLLVIHMVHDIFKRK